MKRSRILASVLVALFALSSSASAESIKSGDSAVRSGRENSGKQIAMAAPKPKKGGDSVEGAIGSARKQLVGQLQSHNISVPVPEVDIPDNMEKSADACYKTVRSTMTFVQEHGAQFGGWFARYLKQLSGPPTVTPCGSPYSINHHIVPSTYGQDHSKMLLTNEGRLKTVVSR